MEVSKLEGRGTLLKDDQGNKVLISDTTGKVMMRLAFNPDKLLQIGEWIPKSRVFKKRIFNEAQIMKAVNGIGFNWEVVRYLEPKYIRVKIQQDWLSIPWKKFDKKKIFLNFKGQGFELQCFMPIPEFSKMKRGVL